MQSKGESCTFMCEVSLYVENVLGTLVMGTSAKTRSDG